MTVKTNSTYFWCATLDDNTEYGVKGDSGLVEATTPAEAFNKASAEARESLPHNMFTIIQFNKVS